MHQIIKYDSCSKMAAADFKKVYSLLSNSLPEVEMRSYEGQLSLFEYPNYKLYVRLDDKKETTAFLAAWEFEEIRFIEHLAVDKKLRGEGVGGQFLDDYLFQDKRLVILEVEPPATEIAKRRIAFYEQHGFLLHTFPYCQLPLKSGDKPLPLNIMSYPTILEKAEFERLRDFIYQNVYHQSI